MHDTNRTNSLLATLIVIVLVLAGPIGWLALLAMGCCGYFD